MSRVLVTIHPCNLWFIYQRWRVETRLVLWALVNVSAHSLSFATAGQAERPNGAADKNAMAGINGRSRRSTNMAGYVEKHGSEETTEYSGQFITSDHVDAGRHAPRSLVRKIKNCI